MFGFKIITQYERGIVFRFGLARRGARGRCGLSSQEPPVGPDLNPASHNRCPEPALGRLRHRRRLRTAGPMPATTDIDLTPDAGQENLARL